VSLHGLYVTEAEGESAAGAAMLKWALTVCRCVKTSDPKL